MSVAPGDGGQFIPRVGGQDGSSLTETGFEAPNRMVDGEGKDHGPGRQGQVLLLHEDDICTSANGSILRRTDRVNVVYEEVTVQSAMAGGEKYRLSLLYT